MNVFEPKNCKSHFFYFLLSIKSHINLNEWSERQQDENCAVFHHQTQCALRRCMRKQVRNEFDRRLPLGDGNFRSRSAIWCLAHCFSTKRYCSHPSSRSGRTHQVGKTSLQQPSKSHPNLLQGILPLRPLRRRFWWRKTHLTIWFYDKTITVIIINFYRCVGIDLNALNRIKVIG